jgi:hypothetical protein
MTTPPGCTRWVIADGYIPEGRDPDPRFDSHETACILNAGGQTVQVTIHLYFADRDPLGPFQVMIPAHRTLHLRFNDLYDPVAVPRGTDFAAVFDSDAPVVVQHTRLDSRDPRLALLSTIAYPAAQ